MFDTFEESIYVIGLNEELLYMNLAAEKLDGLILSECRGRTISELYGLNDTPSLRALRTGQPVNDITFRYNVNGLDVFQICNAWPIIKNGKIVGSYTIQKDVTKLKEVIENNLKMQRELSPVGVNPLGENDREARPGLDNLIGAHPLFLDCLNMVNMSAQSDSPVMLIGKTGTGKEVMAKRIHSLSSRRGRPFIAINCAAIPEALLEGILFGTSKGVYTGAVERKGLFEEAQGGTLFLDELNSMSLYSQSKLLRVLEVKEIQHLGGKEKIKVDVRIISSSSASPREAIESNQIREDLFYRLGVVNIVIPDLADRRSDVLLLSDHFISFYNQEFAKNIQGFSEDIRLFFLKYSWPGNVRQLRHSIESAMNFVTAKDKYIRKRHLPQYLFGPDLRAFFNYDPMDPYHKNGLQTGRGIGSVQVQPHGNEHNSKRKDENLFNHIHEQEKKLITDALIKNKGNITKAAKELNMPRHGLVYRIKKYELK
ncbi:sigma-54-dependent Fis family transcriptional regulator [Deltaproteobacteria bacterium Smac51]|nr:sigma-54-dependent Fis family transcriptional regulator [Deltaproteobacteria bacterium Smac51]